MRRITSQVRGSVALIGLAALTACAHKAGPVHVAPPDPFGYRKVSAVCQTTPVKSESDGTLSASMKVRSDDGLCFLRLNKPEDAHYASFGVAPPPEHGKAFLYNHDGITILDYTPTTAYAGSDSFTVVLVPGGGKPRKHLKVTATVDATGVVVPKPAVTAPPAPTKSTSKKSSKHHSTHHSKTH